jgi:hypothetical protein
LRCLTECAGLLCVADLRNRKKKYWGIENDENETLRGRETRNKKDRGVWGGQGLLNWKGELGGLATEHFMRTRWVGLQVGEQLHRPKEFQTGATLGVAWKPRNKAIREEGDEDERTTQERHGGGAIVKNNGVRRLSNGAKGAAE